MRLFLTFFSTLVFLLVSAFLFLYFGWGLKGYLETVFAVERLSGSQKTQAWAYFYLNDATTYRGTIARIDHVGGYGSVWVWGSGGVKRFFVDQNTVFSFYETCSQPLLNDLKAGKANLTDDRFVYTDLGTWEAKVKIGYFTEVHIASSNPNTLREIYAYDSWWPFEPVILGDVCGN